jgi:hypothetical protein
MKLAQIEIAMTSALIPIKAKEIKLKKEMNMRKDIFKKTHSREMGLLTSLLRHQQMKFLITKVISQI